MNISCIIVKAAHGRTSILKRSPLHHGGFNQETVMISFFHHFYSVRDGCLDGLMQSSPRPSLLFIHRMVESLSTSWIKSYPKSWDEKVAYCSIMSDGRKLFCVCVLGCFMLLFHFFALGMVPEGPIGVKWNLVILFRFVWRHRPRRKKIQKESQAQYNFFFKFLKIQHTIYQSKQILTLI